MAWGDIAKMAKNIGSDIMAGVSGNNSRYAAKLGQRALKSNMSSLQLRSALTNVMSNESKKIYGDNLVKATAKLAKQGLSSGEIQNKLYKSDFTGIADKLLVGQAKKHNMAYKLGDALGGGFRDSFKTLKAGKGFSNALKAGFTKQVNGQTQIRAGRVAGAVMTAGVAGRVASGGGLYRDRYGRVNVPGVPFI